MSPVRSTDLTQTRLIKEVAARLDRPEAEIKEAVQTTWDVIAATLAAGNNVTITNFGTFISYRYGARKVRDPQTGRTWRAREHQRPRFKAADRLVHVVRRRGGSIRKHPKSTPAATS
ncbi:HU family DNA-binding protein [Streptomyces mirabilis]|uniref:HU family DNA-binding protein n=1 Tax=Streptomyces mirabilis TaxID=68239 RepID=UPI0036DF8E84